MKANELMIGDWVLCYNNIKPCKVLAISDEGVNICGFFEKVPFGLAKPIPITPEILEKNGFKKDIHNCSCYYDWSNSDGDDVTLRRYPCGYFELHITDNENLRNVRFPIDYVHELQHALRLCKIDKEIVL